MGVDGAVDGDGRVDRRGRGCERSMGGLMLLHASRKNVIALVELSAGKQMRREQINRYVGCGQWTRGRQVYLA